MTLAETAAELRRLHAAPELLQVVNVWDVVSARAVAALPETRALATAGHSIAASFGYADGEIPVELMLDMAGRIARAVEVPVSADLDDGYGAPGETVRRAIGEGIVGANIEDRLKPLTESVATVQAAVAAAEAEGVPFALNARTDAWLRGRERPREVWIADVVERGSAYLDAGATSVFVPGVFGEAEIEEIVATLGEQKLALIGLPGVPAPARLEALGVARLSYGPTTQRVALGALQDLATDLYSGGVLPDGIRALN
ncbi:isocitrate lyase/phosphoenolpyruvate mutase family protein [Agromyces sp. H3Y2-19a]|uniref:isocitrate lyase/PEP mutase family protein n=1 Tax=Agromyces chromiiresistens TaxID=3030835 RepID=UPI0023B9C728|nr:isocitrate lyase/phosphoenolpyruvate mutase family protein [Agromyces chromiiresistens]MDF0513606.1 isocitrate lyase/phosphoenolpyruvate mutase family protein [Agromyces chromiiresistens]